MANTPGTPAPTGPSTLAETLAARRQTIAYALFAVSGLLVLLGIFLILSSRLREALHIRDLGDVRALWLILFTLITLVGALTVQLMPTGGRLSEGEMLRVVLLGLGATLGVLTTLAGFAVLRYGTFPAPKEGEEGVAWNLYSSVYSEGLANLREVPSSLIWPGLLLLGGLGLMFAGLQLARGSERTSGTLRRLLYGYNVMLATVFLFVCLALLNVLSYFPLGPFRIFAHTYDWTASGMHSLHPTLRNFVSEIDQPVKVYLVAPGRGLLVVEQTRAMLEQARAANPRFFSWESLSPDREAGAFKSLQEKHPTLGREGLLVLYGADDKPREEFIKLSDLYTVASPFTRPSRTADDPDRYEFKGENALYQALVSLSEGRKVVVYFTQGHGEPALKDNLSELRRRLEDYNFEVRELLFELTDENDPKSKRVPKDADLVVLARPTVRVDPSELAALREYVRGEGDNKGKLLALTDVIRSTGAGADTGVDAFLAEFGVRVGQNRILAYSGDDPEEITATTNPALAHPQVFGGGAAEPNPVARAFFPSALGERVTTFTFRDAHTVEPAGGPGGAVVRELVITDPRERVGFRAGPFEIRRMAFWKETDLSKDPFAMRKEMDKDPRLALKTLSEDPLPLAVAVSEPSGAMAQIPGHGAIDSKPVMVVFGDTSWVTNEGLQGAAGNDHFALFSSCLSWLRGRKNIGDTIEAKGRKLYRPEVPEAAAGRVRNLPAVLMCLGVLVVGCGVWIVRRR